MAKAKEPAKPKPEGYKGTGRPSKYLSSFCEKVKDLGALGYSVVEMAAEIGVMRSTLENEWPKEHPEFSVALTRARELSQAWWERKGRENLGSDTFRDSLYRVSMAARFPHDWRENKKIEHEGSAFTVVVEKLGDKE